MAKIKYDAKLVRPDGPYKRGKTTSVISTESGRVIEVFETRTACAKALGIKQEQVSLLVYNQTKMRVQDARYGILKVVDGDEIARRADERARRASEDPTGPIQMVAGESCGSFMADGSPMV